MAQLKKVKSGVPLSRQTVYRDLTARDPRLYLENNGYPGPQHDYQKIIDWTQRFREK